MPDMAAEILDDCIALYIDGEWEASYGAHEADLLDISNAFYGYFHDCRVKGRLVSVGHHSPAIDLWNNGVFEWRSLVAGEIEYNPHHPDFQGDENEEADEEADGEIA